MSSTPIAEDIMDDHDQSENEVEEDGLTNVPELPYLDTETTVLGSGQAPAGLASLRAADIHSIFS